MSDEDNKPAEQTPEPVQLPPQQAPDDTSNWDDRPSTAPDGKEHIKDPSGTDIVTK